MGRGVGLTLNESTVGRGNTIMLSCSVTHSKLQGLTSAVTVYFYIMFNPYRIRKTRRLKMTT